MNLRILLLLLLGTTADLVAQGGGVPPLEIGDVTVIGRRTLILPKARKGEVFDTSHYVLPAGDTLLFGPRISNFEGTAGSLPGYREFAPPVRGLVELSLGSYMSPRALLRGEYAERMFDVGGELDYRSTAGHIDSAEASGLRFLVHGGAIVGDTLPPLRRFRVSGEFEHQGESYFLYGSDRSPFDRSRAMTGIAVALRSQEAHPIAYEARLRYNRTSVDDRGVDTIVTAAATEPSFDLAIAADVAEQVRGCFEFSFSTSSLRYNAPTQTTSDVALTASVEWTPAPLFYLSAGLLYGSGKQSDSGSTSIFLPRIGGRYALDESLTIFGAFAPELRPALYRKLLRAAPYVDREITLRPEEAPVRLVGGIRYADERITLEGRGFYESAENTPFVVADTAGAGRLRYEYVASTTAGVEASMMMAPRGDLRISAEARIMATKADTLNRGLPMRPTMDLRGDAIWKTTPEIEIHASLLYQSERRVRLIDEETIGTRLLLGIGGLYTIIPNLDVIADVSNLLGVTYDLWENYSAPGFEFRAGIRYRVP